MVWEKIFECFLLWLPWQPEFFMEHNYLKEFERGPPKEHSCEIGIKNHSIVSEKFFEGKVDGRTKDTAP